MKRKILYIVCLLAGWLAGWLAGCSEFESVKYTGMPGINFVAGINGASGDYAHSNIAKYNFATDSKGWGSPADTLLVKVKTEGAISASLLRFRLKNDTVAGFKPYELEFFNDYTIPAGECVCSVPVVFHRPEIRDSAYRVKLCFDYEGCDPVPGTKERQSFVFEIKDELTLDMTMRLGWRANAEKILGKYTNTKLRFLVYALETMNLMQVGYYGPNKDELALIKKALNEYDAAHPGKPILDEDGTPLFLNLK